VANVFSGTQTEDKGARSMVTNRVRTIAAIAAVTALTATGIAGANAEGLAAGRASA
jgi:hypothetical protein